MQIRNQDLYNNFLNQLQVGGQLGERLIPAGSYGRVSEGLTPEQRSVRDAYSNFVNSGLQHGNATTRALTGLSNSLAGAGVSNQQKNLLGLFERQAKQGAGAVEQMPLLLDAQRSLLGKAGQVDPLIQEVINLRRQGLGGLNSAENTALREQVLGQTNADYQNALRRSSAMLGGLRGGAAQSRLDESNQAYLRSLQDLNQKQLLANVDIQNQRLNEFDNLGRYVSDSTFSKALNALEPVYNTIFAGSNLLNNYGTAMGQVENDAFNRQQTAAGNLLSGIQSQNAFQNNDLASRLQNYSNLIAGQEADLYNRTTFNLNQLAREQSDQNAIRFGTPQYINTQRANDLSQQVGYAQLNQAQKQAKFPVTPYPGQDLSQIQDPYSGGGSPYA